MKNKQKKTKAAFPNWYWLISLVFLTIFGGYLSYITFFLPLYFSPGARYDPPVFNYIAIAVIAILIATILIYLILQSKKKTIR